MFPEIKRINTKEWLSQHQYHRKKLMQIFDEAGGWIVIHCLLCDEMFIYDEIKTKRD